MLQSKYARGGMIERDEEVGRNMESVNGYRKDIDVGEGVYKYTNRDFKRCVTYTYTISISRTALLADIKS